MTDSEKIRDELILAARALASEGLVTGFGHVSARVASDRFIVTPGKPPGALERADELVEVSLESEEMPPGTPGEVWIHWSVYRRHPDVTSVCRAQPEFAGMMAIASVPIRPVYGHSAFLEGEVPVYDRVELIRSEALGETLVDTLGEAKAILMRGTGAVTVGGSVGEAVALMWTLENTAKMNFFPLLIGEPKTLSPEEISDWRPKKAELLGRVWKYIRDG